MGHKTPEETIAGLRKLLEKCILCPRRCRVDRTRDERGFCGLGADIVMDCAMAHHGEEPPLSGRYGAGTIFLSSCNLRCIYCQNYQISHGTQGERMDSAALARVMLSLQAQRCHNVEPVTPTPQTPQIMEALLLARGKGLTVPFVYNCGGYEDPEIIRMLDGMVDIYLPDFKYGDDADGELFSAAKDYSSYAVASIREMVRQVGADLEMEGNIAKRGILIRHLILPGRMENSFAALRLIQEQISLQTPLSLMAQYTPIAAVARYPLLGRRITRKEYEAVVNYALDLGFENLFTQEVSDRHLAPDFEKDEPFPWQ
jgi:putative pyruvate formate lyase activating enzyme